MQLDFSVSSPCTAYGLLRLNEATFLKIYNTLLVDKNHRTPTAAQASVTSCAVIAVSFLQDIIDALGIGWTFTFIVIGIFLIDYKRGMRWRQNGIATT